MGRPVRSRTRPILERQLTPTAPSARSLSESQVMKPTSKHPGRKRRPDPQEERLRAAMLRSQAETFDIPAMNAIIENLQSRFSLPQAAQAIRYEERIFAFLDILGWSKMIKDSVKDRAVMQRLAGLQLLLHLDKDLHERIQPAFQSYRSHFSDTIIISWLCPPKTDSTIVLTELATIITQLFASRFLVRGAVVQGKVFHRPDIVFGPALVEAYELESHMAIYPRVLVGPSLRRWRESPLAQMDADGQWFINFLPTWGPPQSSGAFLTKVRRFLVRAHALSADDQSTRAKYSWMVNYFNKVLREQDVQEVRPIRLETRS